MRSFPQHERRQNELVVEEDGEPPIRAKRRPRNLPHGREDIKRKDVLDRSWKAGRRQQHRNQGGE